MAFASDWWTGASEKRIKKYSISNYDGKKNIKRVLNSAFYAFVFMKLVQHSLRLLSVTNGLSGKTKAAGEPC